jgi:large subunit ribosomal protein L21
MIAVVEIGGKQYAVEVGMTFIVDRQHADVGSVLEVAPMLIADVDGQKVQVGTPTIEGAKVTFSVDAHMK